MFEAQAGSLTTVTPNSPGICFGFDEWHGLSSIAAAETFCGRDVAGGDRSMQCCVQRLFPSVS